MSPDWKSRAESAKPASGPSESKARIRVKVTRFGKSKKAGGWDVPGDSLTDRGFGAFDAPLSPSLRSGDCALSKPLEVELGVHPRQILRVTFDSDPRIMELRFNDRTDQKLPDKRVDVYLKDLDDPTLPEFGWVEVV